MVKVTKDLQKSYREAFAGGWNAYLGVRQIKDDESPEMLNTDFKGRSAIGSREGYDQIGTPATYTSGVKGMEALHTSALHQLIAFKSNGANAVLSHSTDGGAWTNEAGTTFSDIPIDGVQAAGLLYTGNGTDVMREWDGAAWSDTTNGTKGFFPEYFNQRIWVVDETNLDRLNFSGQYSEQLLTGGGLVNKLGDFSDASAGWISFRFGSGAEITGLKIFRNALYVFLRDSIYSITPASTENTFVITQVTNAVGCVSHRSIDQVGEDLFFASDLGIFSLGEVANYALSIRSTEKSSKIQEVFQNLTSENKAKVVGIYHNYKYHLFYSLFGSSNDSCVGYDTRYGGWVDWRNFPADSTTLYIDSTDEEDLYFGHPTASNVYKMYTGSSTDDGSVISSSWTSKSFDEKTPDIIKVYFDHTFVFGEMDGTITVSVIFNDNQVSANKSITQQKPIGGFGRDEFGRQPLGEATGSSTTVTNFVGIPLRLSVSEQRFAVQYKVATSGIWRLDDITTTYKPLSHYAFPSQNKIN